MSKQISLTQGRVAIVDDEDYEELMRYKWHAHRDHSGAFYARRQAPRVDGKQSAVQMHRQILGTQPGDDVHHRNHATLDNRRANIQNCSRVQHHAGRRKLTGCSSRFKGVNWHKRDKKWEARIQYGGKRQFLGLFSNEADAARAYNVAALEHLGELALLNAV